MVPPRLALAALISTAAASASAGSVDRVVFDAVVTDITLFMAYEGDTEMDGRYVPRDEVTLYPFGPVSLGATLDGSLTYGKDGGIDCLIGAFDCGYWVERGQRSNGYVSALGYEKGRLHFSGGDDGASYNYALSLGRKGGTLRWDDDFFEYAGGAYDVSYLGLSLDLDLVNVRQAKAQPAPRAPQAQEEGTPIAVTPLPAGLPLIGTGLLALAALSRKRRRA